MIRKPIGFFLCVLCVLCADVKAQSTKTPQPLGIGRAATPAEIAAWDIDVHPDGTGLPPGSGTAADGAVLYAVRCSACHGTTGREGPNDRLVGRVPNDAFPFARDPSIPHTIGNYWPYATTVFDYIRRAMPSPAPGSLTDDDVYRLTAFLLAQNDIIKGDDVMDAKSLPKVVMPARDKFVADPRNEKKKK